MPDAYRRLIDDEELEDTEEYADRLEEEVLIQGTVQQYLQQLDEMRSSTAASRRSR